MPEVTLAAVVAYDGSFFSGFARQSQPHVVTIQGEIEHALSILFRRSVLTTCAGRTDAGVHALHQVVSFDLTKDEFSARSLDRLTSALNALVDEHITISLIEERAPGFSARFDAKAREYRYRIYTGVDRPVLISNLVWHIPHTKLDVEEMNKACTYLLGEHDFKSFCKAVSAVDKPTCRNIFELEFTHEIINSYEVLTMRVVGNAFLHSMVRTLAGTLVEVGKGNKPAHWAEEVLKAQDRSRAGQCAPAHGLIFWNVFY
ncbi:MAG: tRNA pseudouridine(38-40) synthase TruA [Eggerthellaceae bacterium]|nr:tRNA pseudouridine(38-40) synthase TruA [Eggerthellaceae bacterium]